MKHKYYLIIVVLLLSFKNGKFNNKVPENLRISTTIIIKRDFESWTKQIDSIPKGYDNYAQKHTYSEYQNTITEVIALFNKHNIKFQLASSSEQYDVNDFNYILDYKITCTGGNLENDWWSCSNGFYFSSSERKFDYLGMSNRIIKAIKKSI
jgi:hypothetical protein